MSHKTETAVALARTLFWLCLSLLAGALTILACRMADAVLTIERTVEYLPPMLVAEIRLQAEASREEVRATREALISEIQAFRRDLRGEAGAIRGMAYRKLDQIAERLDRRLEAISELADQRLAEATDRVDSRLGEVTGQTAQSVAAIEAQATQLFASADRMVNLLTPQLLGLAAAGKVAAGSVAKTARTWERETPQIAANVRETTGNAAKISGFLRKYKVILGIAAAFAAGIASR